jgi:hypothetical protein
MENVWVALRLKTKVKLETQPPLPVESLILPDGVVGVLFAFETPEAARSFWGKDTELIEMGCNSVNQTDK